MTRATLITTVMLSLAALFPAPAMSAVIMPDLETRLSATGPAELVPVIILMAEGPLRAQGETQQGLPRRERQRRYADAMQRFSRRSQDGAMTVIRAEVAAGRADRVRSLFLLNAISARLAPAAVRALAQRTDVRAIVLSRPIVSNPELPGVSNPGAGARTPASPPKGIAWGVQTIGAPTVWAGGNHGEDIVVDVIDTGVDYDHTDLSSRIWTNQAEQGGSAGVDDDGNGYVDDVRGWDFADHDNDPMDAGTTDAWAIMTGATPPHGTHVAGSVAGTGAGGEQVGVAPAARIMIGKVFPDSGSGGTLDDLLAAMDYGVANGADVITMSLGFSITDNGDTSQMLKGIMRAQCDMIRDAGVIMTVAAGNGDPSTGGHFAKPFDIACPGDVPAPWYPGGYLHNGDSTGGVITIGATDSADGIGSFSSRGPAEWDFTISDTSYTNYFPVWADYPFSPGAGLLKPDVCAPGVKILSCKKGGGYWDAIMEGMANWDGTSMATPHVAGLVALMLRANPDLTPAQADSILEATALPLGAAGKDTVFGSGRVRAPEAVAAAAASGVSGGTAAVVPAAGSGLRCAGANPGRGSFELWYDVPAAGRGRVAVYNIAGQLVRVLADDCLRAGRHRIIWDGRNTAGQAAAPGVYLATARQGGVTCALRLVNLR